MNEDILREALHEMFSSLEAVEAQNAAILSFLKEKGIATDETLAPHLERAANASNVRWRAARVRIDYLLSSATKSAEQAGEKQSAEKESAQAKASTAPEAKVTANAARSDLPENQTQSATKSTPENTTEEKAQSAEPQSRAEPNSTEATANPDKPGTENREKENLPNHDLPHKRPEENAA
jgi:hypothetical protein